jgi:hypothetical protein
MTIASGIGTAFDHSTGSVSCQRKDRVSKNWSAIAARLGEQASDPPSGDLSRWTVLADRVSTTEERQTLIGTLSPSTKSSASTAAALCAPVHGKAELHLWQCAGGGQSTTKTPRPDPLIGSEHDGHARMVFAAHRSQNSWWLSGRRSILADTT